MNYKKAKEKWVKERLYSANLNYRRSCSEIFHLAHWDNHFKTWEFPIQKDNKVNAIRTHFWFMGDNIYDKFYEIRKKILLNKVEGFSFDYETYNQKGMESFNVLKEVGLIE